MIIDKEELAEFLLNKGFESSQLWQDGPIHDEVIQFFVNQYEKGSFIDDLKEVMREKEFIYTITDD